MIKDELIALKDELLKEIHSVESKINFQLMLKSQELTEKNNKYMEQINLMLEQNKSLLNSLSSQKLNTDKINDLDNFRKRMDSMMITHEIRINNSINDIKEIQFKIAKDSESINVPGFIGPACKFKNISNYISSNINEVDKLKNETENLKKDNKEIKKKLEEMIKTVIGLVDGSTSKCIDFAGNQNKKLEENIKKRIDELSDKIINFKSLLMTQEKVDEKNEKIFQNILNIMYNKTEIDDKINNLISDFGITLDNFKYKYNEEVMDLLKNSEEKLENEIKENNKEIKEIKLKLNKLNQIQSQLVKNNLSIKNLKNNNIEGHFNNSKTNINIHHNSSLNLKQNENEEEEKYKKFRNSPDKNKTIDSMDDTKNKNNNSIINSSPNKNKEKLNKFNIENYIENDKKELKNPINRTNNIKQNNIYRNYISEENKNCTNNYKNKLKLSNNKSDLSKKIESVKKELNDSPFKEQLNNGMTNLKNKRKEKKNIIINGSHEKKIMINKQKNQDYVSKSSGFDVNTANSQRILLTCKDNKDNDNHNMIKIVDDSFLEKNKTIENTINKRRGYSLHKLAAIGFEERANEILPNVGISKYKRKKTNSPVVKNVFQQPYSINNKIKDSLNIDKPVKITSSFGRTDYAFYDKKEEGINNLINKGINNKIKNYNNKNIELSLTPVTKIKVYGNI